VTGDSPGDHPDDAPAPPLAASLRAGAALLAADRYRAAAAAWRAASAADPAADALLDGLERRATALARAGDRDWPGAVAAARRGRERLGDCPPVVSGVRVDRLRADLAALARDPVRVERDRPAPVAVDGDVPDLDALTFPAAGVAARAVAATVADGDAASDHRATVERAVAYATRDLAADDAGSPFPGLVLDYLASPGGVVLDRLSALVDRRRRREADVDGLFEG
jgi:hypothetical protein